VVGVPRAQESAVAHRSLGSGHSRRESPIEKKGLTMRFGNWRGAALAAALGFLLVAGSAGSAGALGIWRTIPCEVDAVDVKTGGPYFAPPVPYGCYAKDPLGVVAKACGCVKGCLMGSGCDGGGLFGKGGCGHDGCGHDGSGPDGCGAGGLFGKGHGLGGCGLFHRNGCVACGGSGCGFCSGAGLLNKHGFGGCAGTASTICASAQAPSPQAAPSPQVVTPSPQFSCADPGCHIGLKHFHRLGNGCTACGGLGRGCGICGGLGGGGNPCSACGGRGCGLCGGSGNPCSACGGRGCGLCSKAKSLLGSSQALFNKIFHVGYVKYFVGAGGPVPLTPGYVPYVVTTRSPRDYFAFPPYSPVP
jgi:hypothetical protein